MVCASVICVGGRGPNLLWRVTFLGATRLLSVCAALAGCTCVGGELVLEGASAWDKEDFENIIMGDNNDSNTQQPITGGAFQPPTLTNTSATPVPQAQHKVPIRCPGTCVSEAALISM